MKYFIFILCFILFSCNQNSEIFDDNTIKNTSNVLPTGASANDLLSSSTFKKMIVELAYVEGFEPTQQTKNNFVEFIKKHCNKTNGIELRANQITVPNKTTYSIDDIKQLEETNRTVFTTDNTIAVWVLFINKESSKNTDSKTILGTAYRNTSFVIFEETIHEFSNSTFEPSRTLLETTVINHEFGHILGLTNLGTDLQSNHEDTEHPKHCTNKDCLMYWAIETNDGINALFSNTNAPELGTECIDDLKANGGK